MTYAPVGSGLPKACLSSLAYAALRQTRKTSKDLAGFSNLHSHAEQDVQHVALLDFVSATLLTEEARSEARPARLHARHRLAGLDQRPGGPRAPIIVDFSPVYDLRVSPRWPELAGWIPGTIFR